MPLTRKQNKKQPPRRRSVKHKITAMTSANKARSPTVHTYFCKSSTFEKVTKDVLDKRGPFMRSIHSSNVSLCIVEGWYGELIIDKPRVSNAKVVIGLPYEIDIRSFFYGTGVLALRDKGQLHKRLKHIDEHIPKSYLFLSLRVSAWKRLFKSKFVNNSMYVVKPRYFSDSNHGVLMTDSCEEATQWVLAHFQRYPMWVMQEYVEQIGKVPHFMKMDMFLVHSKPAKTVDYFYSNRLALYSLHTPQSLKAHEPPLKRSNLLAFTAKECLDVRGEFMTDATRYMNSVLKKKNFKMLIDRQLPKIVQSIKMATPANSIKTYRKTEVSVHYFSVDLILDKDELFKLIEVNVVPCHLPDTDWCPALRHPCPNATLMAATDTRIMKYKSQLLDELLHYSMDTIVPTSHKPQKQFLVKV